jgi:hypothetical protein
LSKIAYGLDGQGKAHYICDYCELYFGVVDLDLIKHECDETKPRYQNRGVIFNDLDRGKQAKEKG